METALLFYHFLLTVALNQKLPHRITFFTSLATHQYQISMREKLHLPADFANVLYISIYGGSGSVPYFHVHMSTRMKNYHTALGSRVPHGTGFVTSFAWAFLPISPEFVTLKLAVP